MKPRIPTPRTELAMRVYLACGVAIAWVGVVALWCAAGPLVVAATLSPVALAMLAIGLWMHRFPDNQE